MGVCLLKQENRGLVSKIFQFLIRFSFASGVGILQMRSGSFGIRLFVESMARKERGGLLGR